MTLMWIFKCAAWGAAFLGLCYLLQKALKAKCEFMPLITAAAASCVIMACGMLGALYSSAIALYALGFVGFALCAIEKIRAHARPNASFWAAGAFIIVWTAFAAYILRDTFIFIYDDLSHWALVAREMLLTDKLPDADMKTLVFQAYPTGSASFIYYFCRFTGTQESMLLLAQSVLKGFAIMPLFAFVKKNRAFGWATIIAAFLVMLIPNKFLMTLQVDSLLSFMGVGAFAIIYYYRDTPIKSAWCALTILIYFAWVKNGGLYFLFVLSVFITILCKKRFGFKQGAKAFAISFMLPMAAFGAWLLRVKLVFPQGMDSRHAFSVSAYIAHLTSSDATANIVKAFISRLIHPQLTDAALYAVLLLIYAACAITAFIKKDTVMRKHINKNAKWLLLAYIAWLIALLAMYVLSMPEDQALEAASFVRYNRSVLAPLALIALTLALEYVCGESNTASKKLRPLQIAYVAIIIAVSIAYPTVTRTRYFADGATEARVRVARMIEQASVERDKRYLVLCRPGEGELVDKPQSIYYLLKYEFMTDDIDLVYKADSEAEHYSFYSVKMRARLYEPYSEVAYDLESWLKEKIQEYDYTILFQNMPDISDIVYSAANETNAVLLDMTKY